ncbi:MAG: hypothetical protein IKR14_04590 [Lachnospiraceae bacterium]|nr:hypothetical protein [Lachnospiraceae bacterium]
MKKYRKVMVFFAILAALIYLPGTLINAKFLAKNQLANGKNGIHAKLAVEPKDSLDVIVIGDSESYTTVSPMQLWKEYGYTSYAAGQPGAKISDAEDVLATALQLQHPKVVMLEANVLFRYEPKETITQSRLSGALYRKLPLLKYHNVWKSPFIELRTKTYKGFPISSAVKPFEAERELANRSWNTVIAKENQAVFARMKYMCEKNGAQLMLYAAPSPINYNPEKRQSVKTFAEEWAVKCLDLNEKSEELAINWSKDTRDHGDHLNVAGAKKTTDYIGKYLAQNFELPNRKHSEFAAEWNQLLREYEATLARAEHLLDRNFKEIQRKEGIRL